MWPCLHMGGDHIRPRFGEILDIGIHRRDHQMHVHHAFDMRPDRGTGGRTKGDVGHEVTVHHIHMHPIRALRFDGGAFRAEVGEVSGQDGGGDFDGTVEGHGRSPLVP